MSQGFTVLIVEGSARDANHISAAVATLALPLPFHVSTGRDAMAWLGTHDCDVCVLDYSLRDLNAIETLIRIHQRKPTLPIIVTSRAQSEQVAIAAFHAGAVDYIPKKRGYATQVAEVIRQIDQRTLRERGACAAERLRTNVGRQGGPVGSVSPIAPVHGVIAAGSAEPTTQASYHNRLRAIGHELDRCNYRSINLSQVIGGFHVRAIGSWQRTPEVLTFSDHDLQLLIDQGMGRRGTGERVRAHAYWLPTGYEDFLRALGYELDQRKAEAITITEFDQVVVIGGVALLDRQRQVGFGPFQELLSREDISRLLDVAFLHRAET